MPFWNIHTILPQKSLKFPPQSSQLFSNILSTVPKIFRNFLFCKLTWCKILQPLQNVTKLHDLLQIFPHFSEGKKFMRGLGAPAKSAPATGPQPSRISDSTHLERCDAGAETLNPSLKTNSVLSIRLEYNFFNVTEGPHLFELVFAIFITWHPSWRQITKKKIGITHAGEFVDKEDRVFVLCPLPGGRATKEKYQINRAIIKNLTSVREPPGPGAVEVAKGHRYW